MFATFDFRLAGVGQGGDGSWRFYLGHGPGSSAAIELFFNGREFFRRSGDQRETVTPLRVGEWYQVQLVLNLSERRNAGSIGTPSHRVEFSGEVATGWDGSVDYTFIDSYGHLGGTKPALDADYFVIGEQPLTPIDAPAVEMAESVQRERRAQAAALRQQLAALAAARERWKQELQALRVDGPTDLAYAVSEGTPGDARIQLRGEPDRLGESVPRGFLEVLGGDRISGPTAAAGDWNSPNG